MRESKAKEIFEDWFNIHGGSGDKELAWKAFKLGVKIAEIYARDNDD